MRNLTGAVAVYSIAWITVGCSCDEAPSVGAIRDGGSDAASPDARHPDARIPPPDARRTDSAPPPPRDSAPPTKDSTIPDVGSDVSTDAVPDVSIPDATSGIDGSSNDGGSLPDGGSPDASPDSSSTPDGSVSPPIPTTPLTRSSVTEGATDVPRSAWIELDFASGLDPRAASGVSLDCGTGTPGYDVDLVGSATLIVNPRALLPATANCTVSFRGPNGVQQIHFDVVAAGAPAVVPYDRNDKASFEPFPDDFFSDDASTRTGRRVDIRVPEVDASLKILFDSVIAPTRALDGMSPLAPIVVSLPDVVDPTTIPLTAAASTDPFATVALFDVDSASAGYRRRIPFQALLRDELNYDNSAAHVLIVFPSVPLAPRGKYAFVVTNRALVTPSRPLTPSAFFDKVASGQAATADELRLAPVLDRVLDELAGTSPPIRKDDVALALGMTIRSDDDIPKDLVAIRSQVRSAAPPAFTVGSAVADTTPGTDVAAIVEGTWSPPDWSTDGNFVDRDSGGVPTPAGVATLAYTLALPKSAATSPAPIIVYQHGQPGNAQAEVPNAARRGLAKAGFAVVGFTDVANRDIIPNGDIVQLNVEALATLINDQDLPDYLSLLTHADQLAFLRMVPTMGSVDVLPLGAPDGAPDLNASAPLGYLGISQGSVHGVGLMALAPEVHAAALVAGGGRFSATLVHQSSEPLYQGVASLLPTMKRGQFYAGIAAVQAGFDRQDPQNLARFVRRAPLPLGTAARASILMTEGLGDSLVPSYSTRAGASQLGLVQLQPHAETVPFLTSATGPLRGNVDASTTAAFFQFVPSGYTAATPTPGCVSNAQPEGHYCAQTAAEAILQRIRFFTTHVSGVPEIVDPFQ